MCEQNHEQPQRREYLNAARLAFRPRRPRVAPRSPVPVCSPLILSEGGGGRGTRPQSVLAAHPSKHTGWIPVVSLISFPAGSGRPPQVASAPVRPVSSIWRWGTFRVGQEAAGMWAGVSH